MIVIPARHNPFATERLTRALPFDPAWCGTDWPALWEKLQRHQFRGLVTGPHGSGKTTFLDALAGRLATHPCQFQVTHWLLNDTHPRPHWHDLAEQAGAPSRRVLLIDGSERLTWRDWRRLARETRPWAGLIATHHRARPRHGLPVLLQTRTRPEMLVAFVKRLAPDASFSETSLTRLHAACRGNLREALWHCYDRAAAG